tara:strand:- start:1178 stop:2047 length:870 start_codon:yes stop_codon:yes gene_type:complete
MKVITSVVNNPDFIEMQYWTLKEHFKGEYEYIVFNDAKDFPDFTNGGDVGMRKEIENVCKSLNIKCINVKNNHHKYKSCAGSRCADAMNYILEYQKHNPDEYLLLDSDMFLVDSFDPCKFSQNNSAVVLQSRNNQKIHYIWNGIYYFNIHKMKNLDLLNWSCCPGCDVGGMMQRWLKVQAGTKELPDMLEMEKNRSSEEKYHVNDIYFIKYLRSESWRIEELPKNLKENRELIKYLVEDSRNKDGKMFCEIYEDAILHYRAGGNWRKEGMEFHKGSTKKLKEILLKKQV